ncbi:hypothetical protein IF690_11895 [Pseudomonas sp. SK3(2021)]|uniref:hypothetical protein n=1 Tax=Pseudomonas sp. SK3(2021) TaxID=2841064 RepID=UPI00192A739D|nr:hypothetical protein [Pseudomonas sp. SK3(2021)]QQZ44195.1 hypothetical protein IF690_11895 [Pseudomonas sp. SK3(2021)]
MSLFDRIKSFIGRAPKEQIAGYSPSELKSIFIDPLPSSAPALPATPHAISLEDIGVPAFYCALLIDGSDIDAFRSLVESGFTLTNERSFNDLPVKQYENPQKNQHLIVFTSPREFNAVTVRLVTNSADLLHAIQHQGFAVPPPWIAFEGYNPSWWGGHLQGAQGYYNDNYFYPFFKRLSEAEKQAYYARYNATNEWINSLELMDGE